jgi:hypothetical protein
MADYEKSTRYNHELTAPCCKCAYNNKNADMEPCSKCVENVGFGNTESFFERLKEK